MRALNARQDQKVAQYALQSSATKAKEKKKNHNTNPFGGPVSDEIFVVDASGNVIIVPHDHQVEGTRDGKWIQVKDQDGVATGTRKDGGGHARERDIRGREPHGHVPGIANSDGTPWLPIK